MFKALVSTRLVRSATTAAVRHYAGAQTLGNAWGNMTATAAMPSAADSELEQSAMQLTCGYVSVESVTNQSAAQLACRYVRVKGRQQGIFAVHTVELDLRLARNEAGVRAEGHVVDVQDEHRVRQRDEPLRQAVRQTLHVQWQGFGQGRGQKHRAP